MIAARAIKGINELITADDVINARSAAVTCSSLVKLSCVIETLIVSSGEFYAISLITNSSRRKR